MNTVGTFEKVFILRGVHLWEMSYILLQNEIKLQKASLFHIHLFELKTFPQNEKLNSK
jgi:hypothetical protein